MGRRYAMTEARGERAHAKAGKSSTGYVGASGGFNTHPDS